MKALQALRKALQGMRSTKKKKKIPKLTQGNQFRQRGCPEEMCTISKVKAVVEPTGFLYEKRSLVTADQTVSVWRMFMVDIKLASTRNADLLKSRSGSLQLLR